jgi:TDG/mug DNA glycosylase family protein
MALLTLPDLLCPRPRLLLVGLNPGAYSVKVGHYYGRKSNTFWRLLAASGLVPRPLTCEDDATLPSLGIALTDLCKKVTPNVDGVSAEEFRAGRGRIEALVRELEPPVVGFVGLAGYRAAFDRKAGIGLQAQPIAAAQVFVLPSTSPRSLIAYDEQAQLGFWRAMAGLVKP